MRTGRQQWAAVRTYKIAYLPALAIAYAAVARADVTGTYGGQLAVTKPPSTIGVAGTLTETPPRGLVTGTITVSVADPLLNGTYTVRGRANSKIFAVAGKNANLARLAWSGKLGPAGLTGRAMLSAPHDRLFGTITFSTMPTGPGANLYSTNCAPCHGVTGTGIAGLGPNIQCNAAIASFVRAGGLGTGRMPAYPTTTLSDADIALIQSFLAALCAGPGPGGSGGGGGGGTTGPTAYAADCASCHGTGALGLAGLGPDIHCNTAIHDFVRNGLTGPLGVMPAFSVTALPDTTIAAIQTFLNGLCPAPTANQLFVSNCASCHGTDALGLAGLGPDIHCNRGIYSSVRNGLTGPLGVMPAFSTASLTNANIATIQTYLDSLCPAPTADQLFVSNCGSCHGADALGVAGAGPDIHCNVAIHDYVRNGITGPLGVMPAFSATNLPDTDIATIQTLLDSWCPNPTGPQLFASNCASCHGATAAGTATIPSIQCSVGSRIFAAMRNGAGNGVMPVFPVTSVPDAQVNLLVSYVGSLCSGLPLDLFISNCSYCHGATAGGGSGGPNIRCSGATSFLDAVQSGPDGMPTFPDLTSTQVTDMATYVDTNFCPLGG